jgi:hypothetical protein
MKSFAFFVCSVVVLMGALARADELKCQVALEGEFALPPALVKSLLARKGYEVVESGQTAPCSVVSGGYSEADGDYKGMDLLDRTSPTYKPICTLSKKMGLFFVHRQFEKVEMRFLVQTLPACDCLSEAECRAL